MGNHMTDQCFEDWWSRSLARVALSPAAKEVARGAWKAARDDLVAELNGSEPRAVCTNSDTWNCKYCRKTETCAALHQNPAGGVPQARPISKVTPC